ncbi:MAG: ferritin [Alphaproteobacteria bacterium]|nr:ferritin [Alphaproteobacteria bacterium]
MGEMAQKISKVDREELLKILNIAYAEEWLAYYQYWLGAQLIVGPERKAIAEEFIEHATEEFDHAQKLATRIIELGGTPILNPDEWQKVALCKYDAPTKPYVMNLLEQNLVAERCAIVRYQKICEMTHGNDYETYRMAVKILHEEIEHEDEIGCFKDDINALYEYKNKMQD